MATRCKRMLPLVVLVGCSAGHDGERIEPTFIEVAVDGDLGTADAPLEFSGGQVDWTLHVRTLDRNADPYPFNGDLSLRVRPGRLDMAQWVTVTDGQWDGTVSFEAGFGPTRVWVSDEGDKDADSGRKASWATGVTEPIHYAFPTIAQMQRMDPEQPKFTETNQLDHEYAELNIADRHVVVSELATAGFWVTDLDDFVATAEQSEKTGLPLGNHASLFIYSFSKPSGIVQGSRLSLLSGADQEYLATTQLSFPKYTAMGDEALTVPDHVVLDGSLTCSDEAMEALESTRVQATGLLVPADFGPDSPDYEDYVGYGQWPVDDGSGCELYIDSSVLEGFDPVSEAGNELPMVKGVLTQIWSKWIIVATPDSEIGDPIDDGDELRRADRPRPRARLPEKPRQEPWELHEYRSDSLTCPH